MPLLATLLVGLILNILYGAAAIANLHQVCMYVCMYRFGGTSTRAYTRTQARGATPELRHVADTTSHGLSAGRHSTHTTIGSPSLCDRP